MWQFWDYEGEKKRKETGEQSVLNWSQRPEIMGSRQY